MAGKKVSKNNPGQRQGNERTRMLNGKAVKPVMYGKKRLITGEVDGKLVCDNEGNPLPYKSIGELV